jgi:hypothetical protein
MVVVVLATLGALDGLPAWLRGVLQAAGTLSGIWLGAHLQFRDESLRIESAGRSALAHLVALAKSIQILIVNAADHQGRISNAPPQRVDTITRTTEVFVAGVDGQARALLAQARAAAEVWLPYVPDSDQYLTDLADDFDGR